MRGLRLRPEGALRALLGRPVRELRGSEEKLNFTDDARERIRGNVAKAREKIGGMLLPQGGPTMRAADKLTALVFLDVLELLASIDERLERMEQR